MKIYQSLADASLYRTVALIPEQVMFGLALARDPSLRVLPETRRNLELGREFCEVFTHLSTPGEVYHPTTSSAATIAAGIQELNSAELPKWHPQIASVKSLIDAILIGEEPSSEGIDLASQTLRSFASFAKQKLSSISDSESLQPSW